MMEETANEQGRADAVAPARPHILAALDRSAYADAVCDYAAWLMGDSPEAIDLLHVREAGTAGRYDADALLAHAREHLADHGALGGRGQIAEGAVANCVRDTSRPGSTIVLGKRGEGPRQTTLGRNADALVREGPPLCLVSQVYLPVSRGLVLLDADPGHRRTVEHIAHTPPLRDLELDIVVMEPIGGDAEPKLNWARQELGATADVFSMRYGSPDEATGRYLADHQADIIILSREMLLEDERHLRVPLEVRSLWRWRVPVFVC